MKNKNIPQITEKQIKSRVGDQSFQRGKNYFSNKAIFSARQTDNTLKANCEGSRGASYRVTIKFSNKGISEASCSCPVGSGGYCKHVAALLLTWKHRPKEFTQIPDIDLALNKKSKKDLINLIKHLVEQEPDLELSLEVFISPEKDKAPDPEIYQRQANKAFQDSMRQWRGNSDIAYRLSSIVKLGEQLEKDKNFKHAWVVYDGVAREIIRNMVEYGYYDEEGDVCNVVNECVCGLASCLTEIKDSELRKIILRSLFSIIQAEIDLGGIELGYDAPDLVCRHSNDTEKELLIEWIQKISPKSDSWAEEQYNDLLEKLTK